MLKSMTAFGRARATSPSGRLDITAELRSVNGRYLDCSIKLPRMYSFMEDKIRALLAKKGVSRGKLEVYVGIDVLEQTGIAVNVDTAAARSYLAALERLRDEFGLRDDISVMSVAQNRDLFSVKKPEDDLEGDWQEVCPVLEEAIDAFNAMRKKEGRNLCRDLLRKTETIEAYAAKIRELSEADIAGYPARLEQRIRQLLTDFDVEIAEQRILTEAAIYADRAAIDEELVRLESHFTALREILMMNEPGGRKLDFLLQEINREVNTIGSKAGNSEIAHLVVDAKTELEKIREQIQNLE